MVIWTPRARADLKAIHDYIADDSPQNANKNAFENPNKSHSPLIMGAHRQYLVECIYGSTIMFMDL